MVAGRSGEQGGRGNRELQFNGVSVWEDEKWLHNNVNVLNALNCTF